MEKTFDFQGQLKEKGKRVATKSEITKDNLVKQGVDTLEDSGISISKLSNKLSESAGSGIYPIYIKDGKAETCLYKLESDVPTNAKFTDTTYSIATSLLDGLMSKEDKNKLDTISLNASNVSYQSFVKDGQQLGILFIDNKEYPIFSPSSSASITSGVSGIKGSAEQKYRTGNVVISPSDIGLDATKDINKEVRSATCLKNKSGLLTQGNNLQPVYFSNGVPVASTCNFLYDGEQTTISSESGGSNVFTFKQGNQTKTFIVKNGLQGTNGINGKNGKNGLDGKNYWQNDLWISLTDSKYLRDTYYPVVGTAIPKDGLARFKVSVQLNSGTRPEWSAHEYGFSCDLELQDQAHNWGITLGETLIYIDNFSHVKDWISPVSYQQLTNDALPVLYLRGGGSYHVFTTYDVLWTVYTEPYVTRPGTVYEQSARPTTTRPTVRGLPIKGPKGDKGDQGPQGPVGEGVQGPIGPKGIEGWFTTVATYTQAQCINYCTKGKITSWNNSDIQEDKSNGWSIGNRIMLVIKCDNHNNYITYQKVIDNTTLEFLSYWIEYQGDQGIQGDSLEFKWGDGVSNPTTSLGVSIAPTGSSSRDWRWEDLKGQKGDSAEVRFYNYSNTKENEQVTIQNNSVYTGTSIDNVNFVFSSGPLIASIQLTTDDQGYQNSGRVNIYFPAGTKFINKPENYKLGTTYEFSILNDIVVVTELL